jgi:hypothetical protein
MSTDQKSENVFGTSQTLPIPKIYLNNSERIKACQVWNSSKYLKKMKWAINVYEDKLEPLDKTEDAFLFGFDLRVQKI